MKKMNRVMDEMEALIKNPKIAGSRFKVQGSTFGFMVQGFRVRFKVRGSSFRVRSGRTWNPAPCTLHPAPEP
jgi:hypothetical protein